jgi:anthranilate synthase component 2
VILLVDNYDSFTYNLYQILAELGHDVLVVRNDALTVEEALALGPERIVISPGPGRPETSGITVPLVARAAGKVPIFGVCLGLQAVGVAFGGRVVRAPVPMHGKRSPVRHDGRGIFGGLPSPFQAVRYHSLMVDPATLPAELEVTAEADDGVIMGLRHRSLPIEAVQFHPESCFTEHGREILEHACREEAIRP